VAIKVMDKQKLKGLPRGVLNEVNLLKAVDHPCIIRLEDVIETEKELFIALELAEGGDLFERYA
jgi:serine/threonine-protein kinase Chk2